MESELARNASVISQAVTVTHDHLTDTGLDVRALLFIVRNRSGPARIVSCYPVSPDQECIEDELDGHANRAEEEDNDDTASTVDVTSGIPRTSDDSEIDRVKVAKSVLSDIVSPNGIDPTPSVSSPLVVPTPPTKKRPRHPDAKYKHRTSRTLSNEDTLFGVAKDSLAKLLVPGSEREWHLKRFELKINNCQYVGCPVFCKPTSYPRTDANNDAMRPIDATKDATSEVNSEHSLESASSPRSLQDVSSNEKEHSPDGNGERSIHIEQEQQKPNDDAEKSLEETLLSSTTAPIELPRIAQDHKEQREALPENTATEGYFSQSMQSDISSTSWGSESERRLNPLAAFNVVAVLDCSSSEAHRQLELYHKHIGRPLSIWLRRLQETRGWIDRQIRKLEHSRLQTQHAKWSDPNASGLAEYQGSLSQSDIDRLLQDLFLGLKSGHAINLSIGSHYPPLVLKIPVPTSLPFLINSSPGQSRTQLSAALRSTSLSVSRPYRREDSDANDTGGGGKLTAQSDYRWALDTLGIETTEPAAISQHASLVLLAEREELISQLKAPGNHSLPHQDQGLDAAGLASLRNTALSRPLGYFIRNLSYRRTLAQLTSSPQTKTAPADSQHGTPQTAVLPAMPGLTLHDAQVIACILIRAGVARTSLPLHASNTYVVSPTAPIIDMNHASTEWLRRFGHDEDQVPVTLPQILRSLSQPEGGNTPSSDAPDKDHKAAKGMHPKPWAALIPAKDRKTLYMDMLAWLVAHNWVVQIRTFAFIRVSVEVQRAVKQGNAHEDFLKHHHASGTKSDEALDSRPHRSLLSALVTASRPASATGSTGSTRTAVRAPGSTVSHRSSHEQLTRPSSPGQGHEDSESQPKLINSPSHATPIEQQWIDYISEHIQDADARQLWPMLVRYFDGQHALEEVAAMEGWKRALLAGVFKRLAAEGVLQIVRHW